MYIYIYIYIYICFSSRSFQVSRDRYRRMFTKSGTPNAIVDHLFGDSGTSRPRRSPLDVPPLWLVLRYQPILHNALRSALRQVNQSSALLTIAFEGASVPMAQLSYKKHDTPLVQFLNELTR